MLTDQLMQRNGSLERVWLASHSDRRLTRTQLMNVDLNTIIDTITSNDNEILPLRITGSLLLGVTRIYSRKTHYLLDDCNDAVVRIKRSFKKGDVNMPDIPHTSASTKSITMADKVTELDIMVPDGPMDFDMDTDPMMESLSQMASSQDLSNTQDPVFEGYFDRGRNDSVDRSINDLDVGIEGGRRDQDPELLDQRSADEHMMAEQLNKMRVDDDMGELDFEYDKDIDKLAAQHGVDAADAYEGNFDFDHDDNFHLDFNNTQNTLLEEGIVPDRETSVDQVMFDTQNITATEDPSAEPSPKKRRTKRERRLIADKQTKIPQAELRRIMNDASDIINKDMLSRVAYSKKSQPTSEATAADFLKPSAVPSGSKLHAYFSQFGQKRRSSAMDAMHEDHDINDPLDFGDDSPPAGEPQDDGARFDEGPGLEMPMFDNDVDYGFDDFNTGGDPDARATTSPAPEAAAAENAVEPAEEQQLTLADTQQQIEKHAQNTLSTITSTGKTQLVFNDIAPKTSTRQDAARAFYDILLLATKDKLKVKQNRTFGEIQIAV